MPMTPLRAVVGTVGLAAFLLMTGMSWKGCLLLVLGWAAVVAVLWPRER